MDKMMEIALDGKIRFDILPFYQEEKFIEEILAILLEFIADDHRQASGRLLRVLFVCSLTPIQKRKW